MQIFTKKSAFSIKNNRIDQKYSQFQELIIEKKTVEIN